MQAAESDDAEIAEELLKFFVSTNDKECFCATLFTCYDLIRPDVAVELAWRNNYTDFVMPYMIQYLRQLTTTVNAIDERTKPAEEEAETNTYTDPAMGMGMGGPMQIAATAYNDPSMGMGGGMGMGMQQVSVSAAPFR